MKMTRKSESFNVVVARGRSGEFGGHGPPPAQRRSLASERLLELNHSDLFNSDPANENDPQKRVI
jgi:hypothetical protein